MDAGSYIGAFRACTGLSDAAVVCHVPVGCRYSASFFGSASGQSRVMHSCSMVQEHEVVFGGEEKLKMALHRAVERYRAPLTVILSGDVPSIIGDDVGSVLDPKGDDRTLLVEVPGFTGTMSFGYEKALLKLSRIMRPTLQRDRSVNLIGFSPDDYRVAADVRELIGCLGSIGVAVNCTIARCTVDEFASAPAAALNVVLGQGMALAKHMEKEYGVPYIETSYPYGIDATDRMLDAIAGFFSIDRAPNPERLRPFEDVYLFLQSLYGKPVVIRGDFHARPMAGFLRDELGMDVRALACFDEDDNEFEKRANDSESMLVLGSSFEQGLAKRLGLPLLRYVYPVFDRVAVYEDAPYAGYRGAVCLVQDMLNVMLDYNYV